MADPANPLLRTETRKRGGLPGGPHARRPWRPATQLIGPGAPASGPRTWRTRLSDDTGVDTVLPAGSVLFHFGLEVLQEGARRSSVSELRTDTACLPMGFSLPVGGPEAPEDWCSEWTEGGICAGYATVRRRSKGAEGRAGGFRDAGVRLSAPCEALCDPGIPGPGRRGDPQIHILARRRGGEMIWVFI